MLSPYLSRHNLLLGFHGCDESVRNRVLAGYDTLSKSENEYDWLGHGIYFWENNYHRALDFATEISKRGTSPKIKTPSVIGAVFDLGFCLDLLDSEAQRLIPPAFDFLEQSSASTGKALPQNKGGEDRLFRNLDCLVIETLHTLRESKGERHFDSVRAVFVEGDPLYPGAGFHDKSHIQICIRNPDCIKGYFLPRLEDIPSVPLKS